MFKLHHHFEFFLFSESPKTDATLENVRLNLINNRWAWMAAVRNPVPADDFFVSPPTQPKFSRFA